MLLFWHLCLENNGGNLFQSIKEKAVGCQRNGDVVNVLKKLKRRKVQKESQSVRGFDEDGKIHQKTVDTVHASQSISGMKLPAGCMRTLLENMVRVIQVCNDKEGMNQVVLHGHCYRKHQKLSGQNRWTGDSFFFKGDSVQGKESIECDFETENVKAIPKSLSDKDIKEQAEVSEAFSCEVLPA